MIEVRACKALAYVGSMPTDRNCQKGVDIIHTPRSTDSVLEPFLYAVMLHEGELLPTTLTPDVST